MFYSTLLFSVTTLTSLVGAQFGNGLNYTTSGPLNVTASQIPANLRDTWCNSEQTVCPELCGGPQNLKSNDCDPNDFSYSCECKSSTPNITDYAGTLPAFLCAQWKANCVDNQNNSLLGINACQSVVCGNKSVSSVGGGGSPSGSASASSKTASMSSSTSSKNMAAATQIAAAYGTQILAGGMLAAFGLAL